MGAGRVGSPAEGGVRGREVGEREGPGIRGQAKIGPSRSCLKRHWPETVTTATPDTSTNGENSGNVKQIAAVSKALPELEHS